MIGAVALVTILLALLAVTIARYSRLGARDPGELRYVPDESKGELTIVRGPAEGPSPSRSGPAFRTRPDTTGTRRAVASGGTGARGT